MLEKKLTVVIMAAKEGETPIEVRWHDAERYTLTNKSICNLSMNNGNKETCFLAMDFPTVQKLHNELSLILEIEEDIREGRDTRVGVGYFSRRRAR